MRTDPQMKIRLPANIKGWLAEQAARNMRSQTAEIILSIRERMERETKTAPTGAATLAGASPEA